MLRRSGCTVFGKYLYAGKNVRRCLATSTTNEKKPKPAKVQVDYDLGDSFKIWYEELSNYDDGDTIAQDKFLSYVLPFYSGKELVEDRDRPIRAFHVKTRLKKLEEQDLSSNTNQWYINEIRVEKSKPGNANNNNNNNNNDTRHLVMLHGYGASTGWFYKNFKGIIEDSNNIDNLSIHGLDMIGFGLSGRPNVQFKNDEHTKPSLEIKTEGIKWDKYAISLKNKNRLDGKEIKDDEWIEDVEEEEELRKGKLTNKTGIANVIVEKEQVYEYVHNHKELISEVEDVYIETLEKWREANNIEKFDLLAHSLGGYLGMSYILKYPHRVNKVIMVSPGGVERTPFAITNPDYLKIKEGERGIMKFPISDLVESYGFLGRYGLTGSFFRDVWRMRVSLFTFLRWLGPFGPKMLIDRNVDKLTRSGNIKDKVEIDLFLRYIYSCAIRASFGETSITRIFDASVVAKYPVLDKIRDRGSVLKGIDFLWIYGQHDYMYKRCGLAAIEELEKACGEDKGEYRYRTIVNSGHNMYLDNDTDFNKEVIEFLRY